MEEEEGESSEEEEGEAAKRAGRGAEVAPPTDMNYFGATQVKVRLSDWSSVRQTNRLSDCHLWVNLES